MVMHSLLNPERRKKKQKENKKSVRTKKLAANFAEIRGASSNHNLMLMLLCQQTRLPVPSLGLRLPSAPPMEEHAASTPLASSVISNILSTSSVPHVGSLMLDSPTARAAASLPATGPSGVTRDRIQIPGKPMHLVIVITKLNTPISTRRNPSHQVGSRKHGFEASIPGSIKSSECRRISGRLALAFLMCTIAPSLCR